MKIIPKIKEALTPEQELEKAIDRYIDFLYNGYENGYITKEQIMENLKLKF